MLDDIHGLRELCNPMTFCLTLSVCGIHLGRHVKLSKYKDPADLDEGHNLKTISVIIQLSLKQQIWLKSFPSKIKLVKK